MVDTDAKIVEAVEFLGEKGFKPCAHVQCFLEHGFVVNGVILRVLSKQTVEVWADNCIYELHTSKVVLIE